MATTTVTWLKRIWHEDEKYKKLKRKGLIKALKEDYESAQRDLDKCGTVDDASYHTGRVDALSDILYAAGWRLKTNEEYDAERTT